MMFKFEKNELTQIHLSTKKYKVFLLCLEDFNVVVW